MADKTIGWPRVHAGCFGADCEFHCDSNSDDQDYKFPDLKMRWGRGNCRLPTGPVYDAMNSYYCERCYMAVWRHRYPDRKDLKVELGKNQDTKKDFVEDRDDFIKSEQSNNRHSWHKAQKMQKVTEEEEHRDI